MERLTVEGGESLALRLDLPARRRAEAPMVLYLHGFGSRQGGEKAEFFRRRFLDSGLGFCSFDFRGHGESDGEIGSQTLSRSLADIGAVHDYLRRRGMGRILLMGSSMGGACALWYAASCDEVAAVLGIAPAVDMLHALRAWAGPEGLEAWRRDGRRRFSNELVTCDLEWALMEDLESYSFASLKERMRGPALFFQGRLDTSVAWRPILELASECEASAVELHLFMDGDHRLIDRLPSIWRVIAAFLEDRQIW